MKTAVEFIESEVKMSDGVLTKGHLLLIIEQAKAMEKEQKINFGKRCFYEGFEKAENDDANCFTAWRESLDKLLTFKSE